jgi:hypothetical protein
LIFLLLKILKLFGLLIFWLGIPDKGYIPDKVTRVIPEMCRLHYN